MPTLRHRIAALIGAAMVVSTIFFAGGSALAQTGYPPPPTVPACTAGNVRVGNVEVGQTFTITLCGGFRAGTTVTVTVNGTTVLTKTPTNGAVVIVITVVSRTVVQVGDPVNAAAVCGTNTVTATGSGTPGASSGTFNLECESTTGTTERPGGLAFTGANVLLALLIAAVLIVLGVVLVILQRRRRQAL